MEKVHILVCLTMFPHRFITIFCVGFDVSVFLEGCRLLLRCSVWFTSGDVGELAESESEDV